MAVAFGTAPQLTDAESLETLLRATQAVSTDRSLDVACGAGVVACHFAQTVEFAEGVDITPAMLEQARARQERKQLLNLRWTLADVVDLPFAAASFTVVTSRYAFHHMQSPNRVLGEMKRVCAAGGRIAVADICIPGDPEDAALFDRIERINDPSHVHALTQTEWLALFRHAGLPQPQMSQYVLQFPLAQLLRAASRSKEEISEIESEIKDMVAHGKLREIALIDGEAIQFCYPITVFSVSNDELHPRKDDGTHAMGIQQ